jgi:2-methylisocitrate lyase-like PEP mutase family enzyme
VHDYQAAGVAAIQLEDQAFPKKCGHLPNKELIPAEDFVLKLRAALDARSDPELVVIARTDARGPLGFDKAIDRANRYAAAGADVIFVEALQSVEEIERISKEVLAPLMINIVPGGLTPAVSTERLAELGFAIAIHPGLPFSSAARAMLRDLAHLAGQDPEQQVPATPTDYFNLVGLAEWSAIGERYRAEA